VAWDKFFTLAKCNSTVLQFRTPIIASVGKWQLPLFFVDNPRCYLCELCYVMLRYVICRCEVKTWWTCSRTRFSVFCRSICTRSLFTSSFGTGFFLSQQPASSGINRSGQLTLRIAIITRKQWETADLCQRHVVRQVAAPYLVWQRFPLSSIENNVNKNFKVIQNLGFLPDHPQNWITGSFCHFRHSQKISERSVHNFLSYLADTQTDK